MLGIRDALENIEKAQKTINEKICDALKGDCTTCPFKLEHCVAQNLYNIKLNIEKIKSDLEGVLK